MELPWARSDTPLRHRHPDTTLIYAKVDLCALRTLAVAMARGCAMKSYKQAIEDYLALRRGLGFKLRSAGLALLDFAAFLDREQAPHLTNELALRWAMLPRECQPALWAARLRYVRGFARHRPGRRPAYRDTPDTLLPFRPGRARPYLYSDQEIRPVAGGHRPPVGQRPARRNVPLPVWTLDGDGAADQRGDCTGTARRRSATRCADDRGAKFGKSRLVPLHPSSQRVLAR